MSFTDSLFRSSIWSFETQDIVLRRLSELFASPSPNPNPNEPTITTTTGMNDDNNPPSTLEDVSRFSISSDDDDDDDPPPVSLRSLSGGIVASLQSRRSSPQQMAAARDKSLPPVPRAHSMGRNQRRHTSSLISSGLYAIDEISWPMPPGMSLPPLSPSAPEETPTYLVDKMSRLHVFTYVATICMALLCTQIGIGQTLATLREIGASFDITNTSDLTWNLAGYTLAIGTFILLAGRLGDAYGYKRVFLIGFVWSAVWSAISGISVYSTHSLFTVSRVLHGVGAALSLPNGFALLGSTHPPGPQKALAFTLVAAMAPIGLVVGALSAGLLALAWWPLAYWAFALMLLIIAGAGYFAIPQVIQKNAMPATMRDAVLELDIPGAVAGISSWELICFAWNKTSQVGWKEPYIWLALISGALFATLFVLVERYHAPKPLVPFHALSSDTYLALLVGACGWSCFGIWIAYTWQFAENIRHASPLLTTAYVTPCIVIGVLATGSSGFLLQHLRPSIVMLLSLLAFTLGSVLIATMPRVQTYWAQLFLSVLVMSWAVDTSFPAITLALSHSIERQHQGIAASLASTVFYYSFSLGLGVARTVESYVNRGDQSTRGKLRGYRAALYTAVGLAGLGLLICVAILLKAQFRRRAGCRNCRGNQGKQEI